MATDCNFFSIHTRGLYNAITHPNRLEALLNLTIDGELGVGVRVRSTKW